jgi:hypothetical protein
MSDNIKNITCEAAHDWLDEYAAGRLDGEGAALLEAHLSSCGGCAREYAQLAKLTEAINSAALEPPASLRASVMAGIAAQRREAKRLARIRNITRWSAVAAGAVIVLAVAATGIIGRMTRSSADMAGSDALAKSNTAAETYAASARGAEDDIYASAAETAAADEYIAEAMEEAPLMMMAVPSDDVATEGEYAISDAIVDSASSGGGETGAADSSAALSGDVTAASGDMEIPASSGSGDTGAVKSSPGGQITKCSAPQWITAAPSDDKTEEPENAPETKVNETAMEYMPDGSGYTYTAGTPYMSDPYDMPFTAAVSDPCTSADLVGDGALNEWGNTVYVTLDVRERKRLPLLALVVRDFGVGVKEGAPTRDDLSAALVAAGLTEADASALADVLIYGDDGEIRRACLGEYAQLVDGDILTQRWLEAHPDYS